MTEQSDQPDSIAHFQKVLSQQGILLGQHTSYPQSLEQQQASINLALVEISRSIPTTQNHLSVRTPNQPKAPPLAICPNPVTSPAFYQSISPPTREPFSGDLEKSKVFLLQCTLVFQQARSSFPDAPARLLTSAF
ncbi:hypothetical protein ILYODFUR_035594 [Ilyodon furcidens]|uniref:Uncharacterized protein n=1 Tax=Ilyodon furcidens TaxID=33524 RepID=A0ABV0T2W3_9TELE